MTSFCSPVIVYFDMKKAHPEGVPISTPTTASQSTHNQNVPNMLAHWLQKHFEINVCRSGSSEMDVIHQLYDFISGIFSFSFFYLTFCRMVHCIQYIFAGWKVKRYQQKTKPVGLGCVVVGVEVMGFTSDNILQWSYRDTVFLQSALLDLRDRLQ